NARHAARQFFEDDGTPRLCRDQPPEHHDPAFAYHEVVIAPTVRSPAEFDDAQAPALVAILGLPLFEYDDVVRQRLHVQLSLAGGGIIQNEYRATALHEELLERQHLPAIAQGRACKQPQFGQRIEHDAGRSHALNDLAYTACGLGELDFGRMEYRVLLFADEQVLAWHHLEYVSAFERPPVRRRNRTQFMFAFGKRDVDAALALADAFEKKLQCRGGLARARRT